MRWNKKRSWRNVKKVIELKFDLSFLFFCSHQMHLIVQFLKSKRSSCFKFYILFQLPTVCSPNMIWFLVTKTKIVGFGSYFLIKKYSLPFFRQTWTCVKILYYQKFLSCFSSRELKTLYLDFEDKDNVFNTISKKPGTRQSYQTTNYQRYQPSWYIVNEFR